MIIFSKHCIFVPDYPDLLPWSQQSSKWLCPVLLWQHFRYHLFVQLRSIDGHPVSQPGPTYLLQVRGPWWYFKEQVSLSIFLHYAINNFYNPAFLTFLLFFFRRERSYCKWVSNKSFQLKNVGYKKLFLFGSFECLTKETNIFLLINRLCMSTAITTDFQISGE